MAKKSSLGRGLDSLIPKEVNVEIFDEDKNRVQKILIQDIVPNPDQPRRSVDKKALNELTASVKRHGVLQPVIVIRHGKGYRLVAGERRWRAAQAAELTHIPAVIRSLEELEQVELALIENIQREDLSPLEQALAVYKLQHQYNLELEKIAEKLGKAPSTVSNLARLLQLPEAARLALSEGRISEGHARAILALRSAPAKQEELLGCILNNGWTVRQAEQFVIATRKGSTPKQAVEKTASKTDLTRKIGHKIGYDVQIKHSARGGQLIISFKDEQDLEKLAKLLQN